MRSSMNCNADPDEDNVMSQETTSPDRRRFLVAGAATLAAAAAPAAADPSSIPVPPNLKDPRDLLRTFIRMKGSLDDRLVVSSLSGCHLGVVDAVTQPLYGVLAATFQRFRALPDGRFEALSFEVAYFTDLATGKVIDKYLNPYTGETVTVGHARSRPARITYNHDLSFSLTPPIPGFELTHRVRPPVIIGDVLTMAEEGFTVVKVPGQPPFRYSEVSTLHANMADLADPHSPQIPARTAYTAVANWRPWLNMGGRPGHLVGTGAGVLGITLKDLPEEFVRATAERHPDVLKDAGALLKFPA